MRARPESYATTNILTYFHDVLLGNGATGFVYKLGKEYSLVTNWHVLSGINPITKCALSQPNTYLPNRIEFNITTRTFKQSTNQGDQIHELFIKPMNLSIAANNGVEWWESNSSEGIEDIAIIPLNKHVPELSNDNTELYAINSGLMAIVNDENNQPYVTHLLPEVSSEVFILGYPRAQTFQETIPIWKRGSIASEPLFSVKNGNWQNDGILYVDASTTSGMSGSPVLYYGNNFWSIEGNKIQTTNNKEPFFIGVYAGRDGVTNLENDMALGRVWKAQVVDGMHFVANRQKGGTIASKIADL